VAEFWNPTRSRSGYSWAIPPTWSRSGKSPRSCAEPSASAAGPAGTVSSLDQLNGIPCDSGAGTTSVSYGSNGAVTITCTTPTPTPTQTGSATASRTTLRRPPTRWEISSSAVSPAISRPAITSRDTGVVVHQRYRSLRLGHCHGDPQRRERGQPVRLERQHEARRDARRPHRGEPQVAWATPSLAQRTGSQQGAV
jgi:hypothetical protein